jgi:DNA polymerase-3 subunit epsilon
LLVQKALEGFHENLPSFIIFDKGRNPEEKSCIRVEKGRLAGMGYLPLESGLKSEEKIKESLDVASANHYMMQLILNYAQKYPGKVKQTGDGLTVVTGTFSDPGE